MSSNTTTLLVQQAQIRQTDGKFILGDPHIYKRSVTEVTDSIALQETDRFIGATGSILLPVVIDPPVHFREPG